MRGVHRLSFRSFFALLYTAPHRWGGWVLLLVLVAVPVWTAGWWAERHEAAQRLAALHSTQELYALGLRGVIGKYSYLPAVVARQPEVHALLATPNDAALRERVNEDLAEIGRRADALAVYVMDPPVTRWRPAMLARRIALSVTTMRAAPTSSGPCRETWGCSTVWA